MSVSLKELTALCEKVVGNKIKINQVKEDRIADVRIYLTDNTKVSKVTNWIPKKSPEVIIEDIFKWIKENENQLKPILN